MGLVLSDIEQSQTVSAVKAAEHRVLLQIAFFGHLQLVAAALLWAVRLLAAMAFEEELVGASVRAVQLRL